MENSAESNNMNVFFDTSIDGLSHEKRLEAMERLHFLHFVERIDLTKHRCHCKIGHPIVATLEVGPNQNERRKVVCGNCEKFIAWLPKFKNKDKRSPSSIALAVGDFCQCCRKIDVNLVGHHVIEVHEGGSNDPSNIWTVCEPCHTIIHALRRLAQDRTGG